MVTGNSETPSCIADGSQQGAVPSAAPGATPGLWVIVALAAIVAFGTLLRSYRLGERSFWFDEAFFWKLSQFPLGELLERTGEDNYPPLYPVLMKAWSTVFGCSAWALRSLSVLCGAATIVGAFLFCSEASWSDRERWCHAAAWEVSGVGLLGAALVAVNVLQIRWSWDVKMYTLGAMLNVWSSWALLLAMRTKAAPAWLFYTALAVAFLHTHYYALFSVLAQWAFVAVVFLHASCWRPARAVRDASCRRWILAAVVTSAGFAPWVPTFIYQHNRDRALALRPRMTVQKVAETPFAMFCEPEDARPTDAEALAVLAVSEIILFAMLVQPSGASCYTFFAAIAPFALGVAVSLGDTTVFEVRYLVFAQPFWLFAAALALGRVRGVIRRGALGAFLVGCLLLAQAKFWYRSEFGQRPGARAVAQFLEWNRRADEPVLVCSQLYYYPIVYHSADTACFLIFDDENQVRRHCWGSAIVEPHELISRSECAALRSPRIWVVDMIGGWGPSHVPKCPGWEVASERTFRGTWDYEGDYCIVEYTNTRPGNGAFD